MAALFGNFYIEVEMPLQAADEVRCWNWRVVDKKTHAIIVQDWASTREEACGDAILAIEAIPEGERAPGVSLH